MISYIDNTKNVVTEVPITIAASSWSSSAPYTYTWSDARVLAGSSIEVDILSTTSDSSVISLDYEKSVGNIVFTASSKPTADISVNICIINARADLGSSINADTVSTSAITGASNVEEALIANYEQKVNGNQAQWLPSNGYDPLTSETGYFCYGIKPAAIPSQGIPAGYYNYGKLIGDCGGNYKFMEYIDNNGKIAIWNTESSTWNSLLMKHDVSVNANSSATVTLSANSRCSVRTIGVGQAANSIYHIRVDGAGLIGIYVMVAGSSVSLTSATANKLTIQNNTSSALNAFIERYEGTVT